MSQITINQSELEKQIEKIMAKTLKRTQGTPLSFGDTKTEFGGSGGPVKDKSFRGMFHSDSAKKNAQLSSGDFKNPNEFFAILAQGQSDPRLIPSSQIKGFNEGDATAGGYLVPEQATAMIMDASLETEIVRPRATVWPMTSNLRSVPSWDNLDHSSSLYGGLNLVWLGEGATASNQTGKIKKMQLKAKKAGIYCKASSELLEDGADFQSQLGVALSNSLSWGLDYYAFNGNGAGQPLGIFNSPCLITVSVEEGQAPNTIVYENLTEILARLNPSSFSRSVWVANQTCVPQLLTLARVSYL